MIKKIESLPNFLDWPNNARSKVIDKFNELIEIINKQQEEIEQLKRNQFNPELLVTKESIFKHPKKIQIIPDVK